MTDRTQAVPAAAAGGRAAARRAGRPRTKPAQVRRGELMAAAERLFLAHGLEATTVEQITQAAGVAKGSFYLQFETKEELLAALRRRFLDDYLEELDALVGEVPPAQHATRLAVWTAVSLSVLLDQAERRALLFAGPSDYRDPERGSNPAVERLARLLAEGAAAGAWPLSAPVDAASFLFHGLLGLLDGAADGRSRAALEDSAMTLVERLVLAG